MVELLVTIAIIVILAGAATGVGAYVLRSAKKARAQAQLDTIETAISSFYEDWGYYPLRTDNGVQELDDGIEASAPKFWDLNEGLVDPNGRPYVKWEDSGFARKEASGRVYFVDPWDRPFRYQVPGSNNQEMYDLWSTGPDGTSGNSDDITNWGE